MADRGKASFTTMDFSDGIMKNAESKDIYAPERERIMRLSREDAIKEVLKWRKLENSIRKVRSVTNNGILGFGNDTAQ